MKEYKHILVEKGGVYIITLNEPENENRLTNESMKEVSSALEEASKNQGCYAVILTAAGNLFSYGGGQLRNPHKDTSLDIINFGNYFIEMHVAITKCSKPVICAVPGDAMGGGFSVVEACDLAIASDAAEFSIPELLDGTAPAMCMGGLYQQLPKKTAMELCLLGKKLTAEEAVKKGLINEVVPPDRLLSRAKELADSFKNLNPISIMLFKELYRQMGEAAYIRRLERAQAFLIPILKSVEGHNV